MCNKKTKNLDLIRARKLAQIWKIIAIVWRVLDHVFVIGSFAASVMVIFISSDSESTYLITALSSIAAILTLMGFACRPTKYMKNYRKAFQLLNHVLVSNTSKDGKFSDVDKAWEEVVNAITLGELYIGKTYDVDLENDEDL